MWVFLENGTFYSSVVNETDSDLRVVRTRDKRSAELLATWIARYFPDSESTMERTPGADYLYRVWCTEQEWTAYLIEASETAQATNFKSQVAYNKPPTGWLSALHDIWQTMYDFQNKSERPWYLENDIEDEHKGWLEYNRWEKKQTKKKKKGKRK